MIEERVGKSVIRHRYHSNGKFNSFSRDYYTEEYDDNGDLQRIVNIIRLHTDRGIETKEGVVEARYGYDDRGNWTRRELHNDGEFFGVWLRKIEYAP